MHIEPDYRAPEYGHSAETLVSIRKMLGLPLYRRRKVMRGWGHPSCAFIYKYLDFSVDNAFSVKKASDLLVSSKLYMSAPSDFNDPYEFQGQFALETDPVKRRKYFERTAKHQIKNKRMRDDAVRKMVARSNEQPYDINMSFDRMRDLNGVSCFAKDPRNLLMWSHYAAGHRGICLQFNIAQDPGLLMIVHEVNYQDDIAKLTWPRDKDRIVSDVLLRKGKVWALEKEVRYISLTTVRDYLAFNGNALSGVLLGSRFPPSSESILRSLFDQRKKEGLRIPKLYRAKSRRETYGVSLHRIRESDLIGNCP